MSDEENIFNFVIGPKKYLWPDGSFRGEEPPREPGEIYEVSRIDPISKTITIGKKTE